MGCCDPLFESREEEEAATVDECPDCGGPVDEDGDSTDVCGYSPLLCDTCGHRPCDLSC